jgi:RHS repeat-associated protein
LSERVNGVVDTTTYRYDDNGNTIGKTDSTGVTTYTWNDDNRLVQAQIPTTGTVSYTYDSEGIRLSSTVGGTTTQYLVDKNRDYAQVLEERQNGNLTVSYVYGSDLISQERSGTESFYLVDGLGSVVALSNEAGSVTDTYTYQAFGTLDNMTGGTENQYLFAGEQWDESLDEYYLRQRYYEESLGRFLRRDSYEGDIGNPASLHKFIYASNNSISNTDPSGYITRVEIALGLLITSIFANEMLRSSLTFDGFSLDYGLPQPDFFLGVQEMANAGRSVSTWLRTFVSSAIGQTVESSAETARDVLIRNRGRIFGTDETIQGVQSLLRRRGKRVDWLADYGNQGIALIEAKPTISRGYIDDIFSGTDKFSSTLSLMDDAYAVRGKARPTTALVIFGENGSTLSKNAAFTWSSQSARNVPSYLSQSGASIEQLYKDGAPHLVNGMPIYLATP